MSAKNGGRGTPPEPPEGHGPPPPRQEIAIAKQIIRPSLMTTAEKHEDGTLTCSFVGVEMGEAVQHSWTVEEAGQKNLLDALTGGIQVADLSDLAKARVEQPPGA